MTDTAMPYPWENGGDVPGPDDLPILLGRKSPDLFAKVPVWLVLAGASARALQLYVIYHMHVNMLRGDMTVWPKRKQLAALAGFDKVGSIDRYNAELVKLGAIKLIPRRGENGSKLSNVIVLHETPPEGYQGPLTLTDFYRPATP